MCACTEAVRTGVGAVCVVYGRPKWPVTMLNHTDMVQKDVLFFNFGTLRMLVRPAMKRLFCLKAKNGLIIIFLSYPSQRRTAFLMQISLGPPDNENVAACTASSSRASCCRLISWACLLAKTAFDSHLRSYFTFVCRDVHEFYRYPHKRE